MGKMNLTQQNERIAEMRVLVADPYSQLRELLRDILERGIGVGNVVEARNGKDVITMLREVPCDAILADTNMEPLGAVDLTQSIRNGLPGIDPFIPIIVMSGQPNLGEIIAARDAGANDYVAKPLSVKILDLRLHALIAHPRPFIRSNNFFGPDRRRHVVDRYKGENRRSKDPNVVGAGKK